MLPRREQASQPAWPQILIGPDTVNSASDWCVVLPDRAGSHTSNRNQVEGKNEPRYLNKIFEVDYCICSGAILISKVGGCEIRDYLDKFSAVRVVDCINVFGLMEVFG